jgi:hypothetical protein
MRLQDSHPVIVAGLSGAEIRQGKRVENWPVAAREQAAAATIEQQGSDRLPAVIGIALVGFGSIGAVVSRCVAQPIFEKLAQVWADRRCALSGGAPQGRGYLAALLKLSEEPPSHQLPNRGLDSFQWYDLCQCS